MSARITLILLGSVLAAACGGSKPLPSPSTTPIPRVTINAPAPTATPAGTLIPSASPAPGSIPPVTPQPTSPPVIGSPSAHCVNGWHGPLPGSTEYNDGLTILANAMGTTGAWQVTEMRYFTDSTSLPVGGTAPVVARWYVKAALVDDPSFRARWLLEQRSDSTSGVSAVAAWDSQGYKSPDWTAFTGAGPPTTYLGLPGQWSGRPYDFVTGDGGPDGPGLSADASGCLAGT